MLGSKSPYLLPWVLVLALGCGEDPLPVIGDAGPRVDTGIGLDLGVGGGGGGGDGGDGGGGGGGAGGSSACIAQRLSIGLFLSNNACFRGAAGAGGAGGGGHLDTVGAAGSPGLSADVLDLTP
jgi:hypothetical protein